MAPPRILPQLPSVSAKSTTPSRIGSNSGKTGAATAGGGSATAAAGGASTNKSPASNSGSTILPPNLSSPAPVLSTIPDPHTLLNALEKSRSGSAVIAPGRKPALASNNNTNSSSKKDDPNNFDPIDFLNQYYTSEALLVTHLPGLKEATAARMERLEDRISNALQRQSETAAVTRRHVQDAKASVTALEHRIRLVQEKASQSERAVLEITKDMKRLDCAKKHLQRTITTLKRLHMLLHAVEQLRLTVTQKPFPDYKTASNLVDATRLLLAHFEAYTAKVEPMRKLSDKVDDLQHDLRLSVVRGFRIVAFGWPQTIEMEKRQKRAGVQTGIAAEEVYDVTAEPTKMTPDVMRGGILLIDALGKDIRLQFIHGLCQDHLTEYVQVFEPAERNPPKPPEKRVSSFKQSTEPKPEPEHPPTGLDQMEKRFLWCREVLKEVEAKFPYVFPASWNFQACLARNFLNLTRNHITALLDGPRRDPESRNATVLLKALQKTIVFEKEITVWLRREYGTVFKGDENLPPPPSPPKGATTVVTAKSPAEGQEPIDPLMGVASVAFEDYMRPYIELEEQSMAESLASALDDRTVDTRGERPVFISSTNLFVYIKGSITRCTALTKGKAFYLLYQAYRDALHKYAQILQSKLPPANPITAGVVGAIAIAAPFAANKQDTASNANVSYRIANGEEVTVCYVISTCEYCADTMEALEDLIRDTIDEKYKAKIDMMGDQETFHEITAGAIRILVSGLTNRVESGLRALTSTNWALWDSVGEECGYVRIMHEEIEPFVSTIRGLLPTSYFRSFCDKFSTSFTTAYYDALTRIKRISEPGTQQLLLDVYNLKTLFLKLPVLEDLSTPIKKPTAGGSTIAPAMYTKMVQKQFGRIETTLKLVGTPNELLIDNFKVQWPGGTASDLQVIMSLKGMKRNEQAAMLERYGVDPIQALRGATVGVTGATIVSERVQALQDQGQNVAAKVNSDLNQMRQKVDDFRRQFR